MRSRLVSIGAVTVALATSAPFACSEFQPNAVEPSDASAESAAEGGVETDAGAPVDASSADAPLDAPVRTIACGPEQCTLPNEVCCVFFGTLPMPLRFCAEGTCPTNAPNDAGYASKVTVKCDDPTDCDTPGNVCCAAAGGSSCSMTDMAIIECRVRAACPSCEPPDAGGVGRELCRPSVATDCEGGEVCTGTFVTSAPWTDYRFCK